MKEKLEKLKELCDLFQSNIKETSMMKAQKKFFNIKILVMIGVL